MDCDARLSAGTTSRCRQGNQLLQAATSPGNCQGTPAFSNSIPSFGTRPTTRWRLPRVHYPAPTTTSQLPPPTSFFPVAVHRPNILLVPHYHFPVGRGWLLTDAASRTVSFDHGSRSGRSPVRPVVIPHCICRAVRLSTMAGQGHGGDCQRHRWLTEKGFFFFLTSKNLFLARPRMQFIASSDPFLHGNGGCFAFLSLLPFSTGLASVASARHPLFGLDVGCLTSSRPPLQQHDPVVITSSIVRRHSISNPVSLQTQAASLFCYPPSLVPSAKGNFAVAASRPSPPCLSCLTRRLPGAMRRRQRKLCGMNGGSGRTDCPPPRA